MQYRTLALRRAAVEMSLGAGCDVVVVSMIHGHRLGLLLQIVMLEGTKIESSPNS